MKRLQAVLLLPLMVIFVFADFTHEQESYKYRKIADSKNKLMQTITNFTLKKKEEKTKQNLENIPGTPWIDYPLYREIPVTSFNCQHMPAFPGMYANVETGCQVYHVCYDGREGEQGASFLCANGTVFNQKEFTCDWWFNVDCDDAPRHYKLNLNPDTNPYTPATHKKYLLQESL